MKKNKPSLTSFDHQTAAVPGKERQKQRNQNAKPKKGWKKGFLKPSAKKLGSKAQGVPAHGGALQSRRKDRKARPTVNVEEGLEVYCGHVSDWMRVQCAYIKVAQEVVQNMSEAT